MAFTRVKLKYYNGGQYNKSVVLENTTADFNRFCKMIRDGNFIPPARKVAYMKNIDKLVIWLDSQYCDSGQFLNNLYTDIFYNSGVALQQFISLLQKENITDKDFSGLEII